jgi:benzoyl-CoA reductase/2-hydroxyglutaryl-CoA dehydratase subunit BcrC/BadD/HgdB
MVYNSVKTEIEKLKSIETDYIKIIRSCRLEQKKKIISSPCYFIPPEIFAAFDILSLKIPEFLLNRPDFPSVSGMLYDAFIVPEKDCLCSSNLPDKLRVYAFNTPSGYGEDAAVSLHKEIQAMLNNIFNLDIKAINIEALKKETAIYEKLRRLVRSICALRYENRNLLRNSELSLIFETALILPPGTAMDYLTPVYEEIKKMNDKDQVQNIRAMIYGGKKIPDEIADSIEDKGIIIAEDDSCTGRRAFDMSLNAESDYILYEILDSYSYRPLTPCMRPVHERYELLYRLLRNYGIQTVIFFKDEKCSSSINDIDYLRIRMMRDGIDPLVIDKSNYNDVVSGYITNF